MEETKNIPETEAVEEETPAVEADPTEELKALLEQEKENHLRLAAEYDNFRKRTQKEKETTYLDAKADTIGRFLPVFDNLQRALAQETADEAYKKGVEMTMTGLTEILSALGVTVFGEVGEDFDPNYHNAVMHQDDENFGENTICQVFQTGFRVGEKVIRHAMVVVAN